MLAICELRARKTREKSNVLNAKLEDGLALVNLGDELSNDLSEDGRGGLVLGEARERSRPAKNV